MRRTILCCILVALPCAITAAPTVRSERPRIFWRGETWNGPSVERVKGWMGRPEYKARLEKLGRSALGRAVLGKVTGDKTAASDAVAGLKKYKVAGATPARWSEEMVHAAALYDWYRDHPDYDVDSRRAMVAQLEGWCDKAVKYLRGGGATPFYDRTSGVMAGLTVAALALHGDSEKAQGYVDYAYAFFKDRFSTIRESEDGASGGGSYAHYWLFTQMGHTVAAWRSATDWDAAKWITENQNDWLRRQMYFQIWMTYPNGWVVKEGDLWSGSHTDHSQFRQPIDMVTGMYRDGIGRTWADGMYQRHGIHDYHSSMVWQFFVFNDPTIKTEPLDTLGRATVFSPKLHGYVCWRSGWDPDATVVHFRCGETVDHHGSWDQGKFMIFKRTPLAIKDGVYVKYMSAHHVYYKSPWSANCVVFTSDSDAPGTVRKHDGNQPYIDFDGTPSWKEWKEKRDRGIKRPPTGILLETEATERLARAKGDLSAATKGSQWVREVVFLDYKYLVVLDRVKAAEGIAHRWLLQFVNEPMWRLSPNLLMADNGPSRLFCRTLLPAKPKYTTVGGPWNEFNFNGKNRSPSGWHRIRERHKKFPPQMQIGHWRVEVTPTDRADECTYLNVLFPTDTNTFNMAECSAVEQDGKLTVKVGDSEYRFE